MAGVNSRARAPEVKAEFINGEVLLHSPVKRRHIRAVGLLSRAVSIFVDSNELGATATEKALVAGSRNDYEPDICFWKTEKADRFDDDTMIHPIPDFVVEVLSKGTATNDRNLKFDDYERLGASEYWIVDAKKQTVEQFAQAAPEAGKFELLGKFGLEDSIESLVLKGFRIPVRAIFEEKANIQALANLL